MKTFAAHTLALLLTLTLSLAGFAQIDTTKGDPRKVYPLSDPRNPDCPCHKLQEQADKEYAKLQEKEKKNNERNKDKNNDKNVVVLKDKENDKVPDQQVKIAPDTTTKVNTVKTTVTSTGGGSSVTIDKANKKKHRRRFAKWWNKKCDDWFPRRDRWKLRQVDCFDW